MDSTCEFYVNFNVCKFAYCCLRLQCKYKISTDMTKLYFNRS